VDRLEKDYLSLPLALPESEQKWLSQFAAEKAADLR
jgi:hypothetical protein